MQGLLFEDLQGQVDVLPVRGGAQDCQSKPEPAIQLGGGDKNPAIALYDVNEFFIKNICISAFRNVPVGNN